MTRDPEKPDAELVRRALQRHEAALVLYAARLLGDGERARDVVQETFLRLCEQQQSDVESRLAEWLYTVTRNRALDVRAKEKRMGSLEVDTLNSKVSESPHPGARLEEAETRSKVLRGLGELPEKQREVLRLKFQGGLSYRAIGAVTGQPTGTVGYLIHVGLGNLRRILGEEALEGTRS